MNLDNLEVLAPAGDFERLCAALDYGADAVYNHKAIFISPKNNLLGFGDDDGHYRIFSYVGSELTEVICVELADGYLNEARALYIGDYIYIVGENRGVFVYSMSDFEMVTEIK